MTRFAPKVYLVGAGPGDPGLLTCKGRDLLQQADCVLYDHLAEASLLSLAPSHAERLYVGKRRDEHSRSQEEINAMLVERGLAGRLVVRLKGGDPYLFGRGGEEAEALAQANVPFEVVPGVTAPLGIAAYTGVPLTHREHTSCVTFVTGHTAAQVDWTKVVASATIVIYMGMATLPQILDRLIAAGRAPDTPAMAVRWGTRPDQHVVVGTIADLPQRLAEAKLSPPATVIIGEVVGLRHRLDWFGKLPLLGVRVAVTRALEQAVDFTAALRNLGADVQELPTIAFRPPQDWAPVDEAIARLPQYDWLIFTSVNGVQRFFDRLRGSAVDIRQVRGRICAIGPATQEALAAHQLKADLLPTQYVAEFVLAAFAAYDLAGKRILLPRAAVARDVIPRELTTRGALVDVVSVYETVVPDDLPQRAQEVLQDAAPHWITFTSSSTVQNLLQTVSPALLAATRIASIGPVTSATIRQFGLSVDAEASPYTTAGLLHALLQQASV